VAGKGNHRGEKKEKKGGQKDGVRGHKGNQKWKSQRTRKNNEKHKKTAGYKSEEPRTGEAHFFWRLTTGLQTWAEAKPVRKKSQGAKTLGGGVEKGWVPPNGPDGGDPLESGVNLGFRDIGKIVGDHNQGGEKKVAFGGGQTRTDLRGGRGGKGPVGKAGGQQRGNCPVQLVLKGEGERTVELERWQKDCLERKTTHRRNFRWGFLIGRKKRGGVHQGWSGKKRTRKRSVVPKKKGGEPIRGRKTTKMILVSSGFGDGRKLTRKKNQERGWANT